MATHSSILPRRIPWTEESMGLQRVRHDRSDLSHTHAYICIYVYIYMHVCVIYIYFFFIFLSIMVYHRIVTLLPCAVQWDLVYPSCI